MKRCVCLVIGLGLFFVSGCNKKNQQAAVVPSEEMATVVTAVQTKVEPAGVSVSSSEDNNQSVPVAVNAPAEISKPESPDVPSEKDIQLALKSAGLYEGMIDGKVGPKTRAAIEEFQRKNDLKVDGKVGARTWSLLRGYYTSLAASASSEIKD